MNHTEFKDPAGKLVQHRDEVLGAYVYFHPGPLPRDLPLAPETTKLVSDADLMLGRLSGAGELVPEPNLLLRPYITREAVLSSRIEGTQASMADVFEQTADGDMDAEDHDTQEVINYIRALDYGLTQIDGPISPKMIRQMHAILLRGVRGELKDPGGFRETQNWIGPPGCLLDEATYVPPAPHALVPLMHEFEAFLHSKRAPLLVHTALMHYGFEAMHPFRDGNGRIGRLLITLSLCRSGVLSQPLLYLSDFFEKNKSEYYDLLLAVSRDSRYEDWIAFFVRGVRTQAADALERTRMILRLRERYAQELQRTQNTNALALMNRLFENPVISIPGASRFLERQGLAHTYPTAKRAVEQLEELGILEETTGQKRNRRYLAREILAAVEGDVRRG